MGINIDNNPTMEDQLPNNIYLSWNWQATFWFASSIEWSRTGLIIATSGPELLHQIPQCVGY